MQTTRWLDNQTIDLNEAIALLTDAVPDDPIGDSISWKNWQFQKISEDNINGHFNNRNITFNIVKYMVDQITDGPLPLEDRTVKKEGFVIAYTNDVNVNYITDRNSGAKTFLRKILSYTGKNEIEKNMYDLNNEFFIWLIAKVYNSENIIESGSDTLADIQLDAIKGFKGDTEDLLTKVSATGESVMNIISTLSFLLESSNLNQIKLDLKYSDHDNIGLVLKRGVVTADAEQYCGPLEQETVFEIKMAKIYLLVYLEILPVLMQAYHSDVSDGIWNKQIYTEFMNVVARDLGERIQQKIKSINQ